MSLGVALPKLELVSEPTCLTSETFDAVIVVAPAKAPTGLEAIDGALAIARAVDRHLDASVSLVASAQVAGGRLVYAPIASLSRDHDDVRRFGDAAQAGLRRAALAGSTRPVLVARGFEARADHAEALTVAAIEALGACWAPLEAREAKGEALAEPVEAVGLWVEGASVDPAWVESLEEGRREARDVTGTEPERMAPERVAEYCKKAFEGTAVAVTVLEERATLERDYPLLSAVARASFAVPRHRPRVIRLEYVGEGTIEQTLLLAGKGVTYDTGGADVKYGGHMAGMSRDKGGAGAVVGILAAAARLKPKGVRIVAEIGAVRNSIGADAFVSDEIIVSHAGVRVRIGNTDAEGRLVLADLLSHLREEALGSSAPKLFSFATLTGHVGRAVGPYPVALDNGPARAAGVAASLAEAGERWGDPFEISRLRREDWDFVAPRTAADDVLSCNNGPSTATPRGHQFPMAFLAIASGLDGHGIDADRPLPFTHVDIGGAAVEGGDWQHGRPTGTPVIAFARAFFGA